MMDLSLAIEALLPEAQYFGSTTANTKECFDNLDWLDARPKPTWKQLQDIWTTLEPKLLTEAKAKAQAKADLLKRLGITQDEAKLLLG